MTLTNIILLFLGVIVAMFLIGVGFVVIWVKQKTKDKVFVLLSSPGEVRGKLASVLGDQIVVKGKPHMNFVMPEKTKNTRWPGGFPRWLSEPVPIVVLDTQSLLPIPLDGVPTSISPELLNRLNDPAFVEGLARDARHAISPSSQRPLGSRIVYFAMLLLVGLSIASIYFIYTMSANIDTMITMLGG